MTEFRPIRVLVVEDEPPGAMRLLELLRRRSDIQLLSVAEDYHHAVNAIREEEPDLVFLDIQIPGGTGFDVIRAIGVGDMPVTVFVTAYESYALRAFEMSAVDYLLKPYSDQRFEEALRKARCMLAGEEIEHMRHGLQALVAEVDAAEGGSAGESAPRYLERIPVSSHGQSRIVPVPAIELIKADGVYAELHTADAKYLVRASLHTLEQQLDPAHFFRVHRSAIVRLDQVEIFHRRSGGVYSVRLKSGAKVRVARSRRQELERRLRGS